MKSLKISVILALLCGSLIAQTSWEPQGNVVRDVEILYGLRNDMATSFTTATLTVTTSIASEGLSLADSKYLYLGTGNDMGLWFDGSVTSLEGVGDIRLRSTDASTIFLGTNNSWRWTVSTTGHLTPYADSSYDIGSSANQVKDIYADSLVIEGGATIGGNVTISGDLTVLGSQSLSASMYFNTNTTAITPSDADTVGVTNFTTGPVTGLTFDAGNNEPFTEAVSYGGGDTTGIYDAGTNIIAGDRIYVHGSSVAGYDGGHEVVLVTADTIYFAETFSATATGRYSQASSLTLSQSGITAQTFSIDLSFSVSCAGSPAGDIVDWGIAINGVAQVPMAIRRTVSTGSVWGVASTSGDVTLSTGDEITMFLVSDDTNALTHRYGSIMVHQD